MKKIFRMKRLLYCLMVTCVLMDADAQQMIEIPNVNSYKQVASAVNGGPSLASADEFGRCVADIGDINNDGINDMAVGAPGDNTAATHAGAVYICFMNTDGSVKTSPAPVKIATGLSLSASDNFGVSVAGIGDLNGDGNKDIAVGAYKSDFGTTAIDCGAVYILFLNSSGSVSSAQKITRTSTEFTGLVSSANFGVSISNLGDINGDQVTDLAVGAPGQDGTQGSVFILKLKNTGRPKSTNEVKEGVGNLGSNPLDAGDNFGYAVCSSGDLNGDGKKDVIAGANGDDDGYSNAGALWVVYLDTAGVVGGTKKISNPMTTTHYFPASTGVSFGESIVVTDINQDGIKDIAAGVKTFNASKGGFYFLVLDASQNVQAIKTIGFNYGWTYGGPSTAPQFGCAVCETNLSGNTYHKQYIVGANFHNQTATTQGSFYYLNMDSLTLNYPVGDVIGYSKISDASGDFTATLIDVDLVGADGATIGDINNDGVMDIALGANGDNTGANDAGAVYVMRMRADGRVKAYTKIAKGSGGLASGTLAASDQFGWGVAPAGDFNGDGIEDMLVGAPTDDAGGTDAGAVYIVYLDTSGAVKTGTTPSKIVHPDHIAGDRFGIDIDTIGDLDNDGVRDFVVGAYLNDDGGTSTSNRGAVYIIFMNAAGTVKSYQRISNTQGSFGGSFADNGLFGIGVDGIGDFNGDGKEDIAVGANIDNTGAVYLIYLNTTGTVSGYKKINNASPNNFPYTLKSGGQFGSSVQMVPDMDGNGVKDLMISSPGYVSYGLSRGAVWTAMLDASGNVIDARLVTDSCGRLYTNMHATYVFGSCLRYYGTDSVGNVKAFAGVRDDDVGSDRGGALLMSILPGRSAKFFAHQFTELKNTPDGGSYLPSVGIIRFVYNEEYQVGTSKKLQYRLYNNTHQLIGEVNSSGTATITGSPLLSIVYGKNKVIANFSPLGLTTGYYLLEVINSKNEKYYLKFKV